MGIEAHTQNSVNFSLPTTASSAPTQHQPLAAENVPPNMAENVPPNMAEDVPPNMAENVPPNMDFNETTYLDADDFYVVKPSTESKYQQPRFDEKVPWI
ncbi:hypothetical protein EB796_011397 [Bugula neritina]|uniref:Uncharacterized protein n=1 Tax=Bugula neritina TaxID=10212 RepID=A0A7J7JWP4_BUGNE|nr:hypothetical protein EB796_011397 [Bugula neritina]